VDDRRTGKAADCVEGGALAVAVYRNEAAREAHRKARREFWYRYPERWSVYQKVCRAIKRGQLSKPDRCSRCGAVGRIIGHHHDYSKPLEVE